MPRGKIDGQPAYILHSYPFRETSLIVEAFSRDFGRIALMARGARRPRSPLRGLLMGFQPLELGWSGKGDVLTLMKAEWQGGQPLLSGQALLCAYYLNELLMHLLPREDPHEHLFLRYAEVMRQLADDPEAQVREAALRCFEKNLLQELGYGLTLDRDHAGEPIEAEALYNYQVERGPMRLEGITPESLAVSGRTLLDLAAGHFSGARSRAEAKALMRSLISHHLGGADLETRKIFKELQEL